MKRALIVLAAALATALGTVGPGGAVSLEPTVTGSPLADPEHDCLEPVPEAGEVTSGGDAISLDVFLLIDGLTNERAMSVMREAAKSYVPLNISLKIRGTKRIKVPGEAPRPGGSTPSAQDQVLFDEIRKAVGGKRPAGTDVVHLLTHKDVYYLDNGEPAYSLAGVADCIGGVRYDDHAFSFSEGSGEYAAPRDLTGLIAAHEIGHLMGAHHHYGNCGQGGRQGLRARSCSRSSSR